MFSTGKFPSSLTQKTDKKKKNHNMAIEQSREHSSWLSRSTYRSADIQINVRGVPFTLNKELLVARSAKISAILQTNPNEDLSHVLRDIPADPETFELIARFCHGYEITISNENVVPVSCVAYYLEMTETHSTDNLLSRALTFVEQRILPSWNESVKAIRATDYILQQAARLGLVDACGESIISKALADPRLLGEPIKNPTNDEDEDEDESEDDDENVFRPNARRKLFVLDWKSEDLTNLSLRLYEPIITEMTRRQVPSEYLAASLCQYAKKWVFSCTTTGREEDVLIYKRDSRKDVIEAVERLLPNEKKGLLPCTLLFEMLRFAIELEASSDCRDGFEAKIGKQLDKATVKDLLIPSQGYSKEVQYDIECVRRILKQFYTNYICLNLSGIIKVAELIEDFLAEIASDIDLKTDAFVTLADMSVAASAGTQRNSDGIYRAIDIYLDKHRYLTESEREEVCRMLDCHKLSPAACAHAAQNEKFPLRVVVQVLFVSQLHLRDTMVRDDMQGGDDRQVVKVENREKEEAITKSGGEEKVRTEMEIMGSKVLELKRECGMMRRKIENGNCHKKEKVSMWKEMKRKLGCLSSMHDCNCQAKKKKVHPR